MKRSAWFACCLCLLASVAWGRTWTDDTGAFRVEAEFVKFESGKVVLKTTDGRTVAVPATRLSDADQEYVRKLLANSRPKLVGKARIMAALSSPSQFEFIERPLADVMAYVSDLHDIPIVIDRRSLEEEGVGDDTPITMNAKGNLNDLLDRMLANEDLTWTVREQVLYITTVTHAKETMLPRVYRLKRRLAFDAIIADLTKTIAPESWADVGGGADAKPLEPNYLLVLQSFAAQRQIEKHYADSLEPIDAPEAILAIPGQETPVKELNAVAQVEVIETPLQDVAKFLSDQTGIEIRLDKKALDAEGIGSDTPVTSNLKDLPLASLLTLLTEMLDLTWVVDKGGVVITTYESAESKMILAAYDMPVIVRNDRALIDVCEGVILPSSWDSVGGPGTIRMGARGKLEMRQSFAAHQQLLKVLAELNAKQR